MGSEIAIMYVIDTYLYINIDMYFYMYMYAIYKIYILHINIRVHFLETNIILINPSGVWQC